MMRKTIKYGKYSHGGGKCQKMRVNISLSILIDIQPYEMYWHFIVYNYT